MTLFQSVYTRSHFTDYIVISSHSFVENNKDKKTTTKHLSELVVTISNWHYVRDNLSNPRINKCTLADCAIGLKLSSSVFKPASVVASEASRDNPYYFDRNGATIPYDAFFALLHQLDFEEFLNHVKRRYETTAGPLALNAEEEDLAGHPACSQVAQNQEEEVEEEEEEEEGDEAPKSKRSKKQNNKKKAS